MQLFLFLFFFILFIFFVFLRHIFIRFLKQRILTQYDFHEIVYHYGNKLLSLDYLYAKGKNSFIFLKSLEINFNIYGFVFNDLPFLQITVGQYEFNSSNQNDEKAENKPKNPFETWVTQKIIVFIFAIFIKSAYIEIHNFTFIKNNIRINIDSFSSKYFRKSNKIKFKGSFKNIIVYHTHDNEFSYAISNVPDISISLNSSLLSFKYILAGLLSKLKYSLDELTLNYSDGKLSINQIKVFIYMHHQKDTNTYMIIDNFIILFPLYNFYTKKLNVTMNNLELTIKPLKLSFDYIESTRNEKKILISNRISLYKDRIEFEKLDFTFSTTFLIDLSLLNRKYEIDLFDLFIAKRHIYSPCSILNLELSDHHLLTFHFKKFSFFERSISFKHLFLDIFLISCVNSTQKFKYRILELYRSTFNYKNQNISLKSVSSNIFISNKFAEISFFPELISIFKFLNQQKVFKEMNINSFSIEINQLKFEILSNKLSTKIYRSNEAKKIAMDGILLRQEKAMEIIKAKYSQEIENVQTKYKTNQKMENNINYEFSTSSFDEKSKEMIFRLFKETITSVSAQNENDLIVINSDGFFLVFNLIPSTKEKNIQLLKNIIPNEHISNNELGNIVHGKMNLNITNIIVSAPRIGKIASSFNVKINSELFKCNKIANKMDDFYHFVIACDNDTYSFKIPVTSNISTKVISINSSSSKLYCKYSKVLFELWQDFMISTRFFRKDKFDFRRLSFYDIIRLNYRVNISLNIDSVDIDYNSIFTPYSHFPLMKFQLSNLSLKCQNFEISITANTFTSHSLSSQNISTDYSFFFTVPNIHIAIKILSYNQNKELLDKSNFIIEVHSWRMIDKNYDPFDGSRTSFYDLDFSLKFDQKNLPSINLDTLQPIIDNFFSKSHTQDNYSFQKFFHPPIFFHISEYSPRLNKLSIKAILSGLIITMNHNSFFSKFTGNPISINFSFMKNFIHSYNNFVLTLDIYSNIIQMVMKNNEQLLIDSKIYNSKCNISTSSQIVKQDSGEQNEDNFIYLNSLYNVLLQNISFKINILNIESEVSSRLMLFLSNAKFPFHYPISENEIDLSIFDSYDQLHQITNNFDQKEILFLSIESTKIIFRLENNQIITSNIHKICFQQNQYKNKNLKSKTPIINKISFKLLNLVTDSSLRSNLIELQNNNIIFCINHQLLYNHFEADLFLISPNNKDFEFFLPKIKKFLTDALNKNRIKPRNVSVFYLSINQLQVHLYIEKSDMVKIQCEDIFLSTKKSREKHEIGEAIIRDINIYHESKFLDDFNTIISSKTQPFFNFKYVKYPQIIKCPFFRNITINLSNLVLRIDVPFFKKIIEVYPSLSDLRTLKEEIEIGIDNASSIANNKFITSDAESNILTSDKERSTFNRNVYGSIFCQTFTFHEFPIVYSLRRKQEGMLKEFKDRNLVFGKIEYLDYYGDYSFLVDDVKKHVSYIFSKSVSMLVFKKKMKITPQSTTPNSKYNSE